MILKKLLIQLFVMGLVAGCATNGSQVREAIKKNPDIVFNVIEEHPDQFLAVLNRTAQVAQKNAYEKQMAELQRQQEEDLKNPRKPELNEGRRLLGDKKAKIVLVEYADFQCPACRVAFGELQRFKEKHQGDVQFYYKNMPLDFHPMAYPAATYFEAIAAQDKVKAVKFYEYLFQNQDSLTDEAFLKKAAKQVGANADKAEKDSKSDKIREQIYADMAEFQKFGFTGTPVMILNGVALQGAQRLEDLERVLALTGK